MRKPYQSLTKVIARAIVFVALTFFITIGTTIFALYSSFDDAGAINVAGSLRMQSFRLAYDLTTNSKQLDLHLKQFDDSIHSEHLKSLENLATPTLLLANYSEITKQWYLIKSQLEAGDTESYLNRVQAFVSQIDQFVAGLQNFSEFKLRLLGYVYAIGFLLVLIVVLFILFYTQKRIADPLLTLVTACVKIKQGDFKTRVKEGIPNELGTLSRTFNNMSADLGELYGNLEQQVKSKTAMFESANESLKTLYSCSQELSNHVVNDSNFENILVRLRQSECLSAIELTIGETRGAHTRVTVGEPRDDEWDQIELTLDEQLLGELRWQRSLKTERVNRALIKNIGMILARGIYYNQMQKQTQQLMLMTERATIARELHDSIAQSLSYLKIQTTLLLRSIDQANFLSALDTAKEIDLQLNVAYSQLRELLATFRLQIEEADFTLALEEMILPLRGQTNSNIVIVNQLPSNLLSASNQVHVLQIIREATLNAIKHASANNITIECVYCNNLVSVIVSDDGVGFSGNERKENHFGLDIMNERAQRLHGKVSVAAAPSLGCTITLEFPLNINVE